ncbi:MAG: bifunctional tetrahydrofolate synthase/dihydrofolate synthase [Pontibacterium sp.]
MREQYSLSQWLEWIESCHPSEIDMGLERVQKVALALGLTQLDMKVITVAGTNGKGSTVTYLDTIYREQGYSVGAFTSPHFHEYNERIQVNGLPASDEIICRAFQAIDQARGKIELTYFEFGTLAALWVFKHSFLDVAILEVGLGGRLDAVNICEPDVSVVTSIGIDHVDWLGDDREVIGFEKAGIFRANKPAVCGDPNPPHSIKAHAESIGAKLFQLGSEFSLQSGEQARFSWQGQSSEGEGLELTDIEVGSLPIENIPTAIQAVKALGLPVSDRALRLGVKLATMVGRMQTIAHSRGDIVLDVAHNPHAAERLAKVLAKSPKQQIVVLGMLADKDATAVVAALKPHVKYWLLVDLDVPRGLSAKALMAKMPEGIPRDSIACYSDMASAVADAVSLLDPASSVLVAGSFFTVANALTELKDL